ncbi:hypothetical protein GGR51DRAFT_365048 [Nemania sp. FL0031]|nr:hypothetical protein GGR51DRAFT_365048 [Nemania sp. FL0031]
MDAEPAPPPLCTRCKEQDGVLDLRSDAVCETCFAAFIASKAIKRLEVLQRETRGLWQPSQPQRYLLALSRGPSSTALLHILHENMRRQRERNQRVRVELVVAFVDIDVDVPVEGGKRANSSNSTETAKASSSSSPSVTSASTNSPEELAVSSSPPDAFAAYFPDIPIHTMPLSGILSSQAIDWPSLPAQNTSLPPSQRLADFFARLPSASARADVSRLLTRHALFAAAAEHDCAVVLLGYTTTALAELTLSEAAKGRGFGIPWLVNDGAFPLPRTVDPPSPLAPSGDDSPDTNSAPSTANGDSTAGTSSTSKIQIYSPLREIFRKEVLTYLSIVKSPAGPLADLFPSPNTNGTGAVVSHRDLSLDDVVSRYFADVEASYPSVVANVVRTTGKLNRNAPVSDAHRDMNLEAAGRQCGLCGVRLDPLGDERWKGEIGEADATSLGAVDERGNIRGGKKSRLCYGCDRSVKG